MVNRFINTRMIYFIPLFYVAVIIYAYHEIQLTYVWGPFYQHGLTLILAWISIDIHYG